MDRKFTKRFGRRQMIAVSAILAILVLAWVGGWFWLANWADQQATAALGELSKRGVEVDCRDRTIAGFPFSLRLACAETRVSDRGSDSSASLAGLTGGASVFAPMTMRVSLTAPVQAASPQFGTADLRWRNAEISAGLGLNGPRDVAFQAEGLEADLAVAKSPVHSIAARSADGSLGLSASGGSNIAVAFDALNVSLAGMTLPSVSGSAKGELSAPPRALLAGRAAIQAPIWARGIDIDVQSGGARFKATGEIAIDAEGIVDGTLMLKIAGTEALPALIDLLPQSLRQEANGAVAGILIFGKSGELDGQPTSEVSIEIERSRVSIGNTDIVTLPPVPM